MRHRWLVVVAFVLVPIIVSGDFPPGTTQFPETGAVDVVAAPGGGVWVGTDAGLAHYTAEGLVTSFATPGIGARRHLALAADGSIWFANQTIIGRITTAGVMVEQYAMTEVRALAVASDGALFYARATLGQTMGRIVAGVPTEFPSPTQVWNIARAPDGDVWVLGNGFGGPNDSLHRVDESGASTSIPLGEDLLFGDLQMLADGTVYVSTGLNHRLLRLPPAGTAIEPVADLPGPAFVADESGDVWTGSEGLLAVINRAGVTIARTAMPNDTRQCDHPRYLYEPKAIDTAGGVWIRVVAEPPVSIGFPIPCTEPPPPPLPDLIRIDAAVFLAAHVPGHQVPLSPLALAVLALAVALAGVWQLFR